MIYTQLVKKGEYYANGHTAMCIVLGSSEGDGLWRIL